MSIADFFFHFFRNKKMSKNKFALLTILCRDIISLRGKILENYNFGQDMHFNEFLKMFYESVPEIEELPLKKYNRLTMSELEVYGIQFSKFKRIFQGRTKKFQIAVSKLEKEQTKMLNNRKLSLSQKEKEINNLRQQIEMIKEEEAKERHLISYYKMLFHSMVAKLEEVMKNDGNQPTKFLLFLLKEGSLLSQNNSTFNKELLLQTNQSLNLYDHLIEVPSQYDKRILFKRKF